MVYAKVYVVNVKDTMKKQIQGKILGDVPDFSGTYTRKNPILIFPNKKQKIFASG